MSDWENDWGNHSIHKSLEKIPFSNSSNAKTLKSEIENKKKYNNSSLSVFKNLEQMNEIEASELHTKETKKHIKLPPMAVRSSISLKENQYDKRGKNEMVNVYTKSMNEKKTSERYSSNDEDDQSNNGTNKLFSYKINKKNYIEQIEPFDLVKKTFDFKLEDREKLDSTVRDRVLNDNEKVKFCPEALNSFLNKTNFFEKGLKSSDYDSNQACSKFSNTCIDHSSQYKDKKKSVFPVKFGVTNDVSSTASKCVDNPQWQNSDFPNNDNYTRKKLSLEKERQKKIEKVKNFLAFQSKENFANSNDLCKNCGIEGHYQYNCPTNKPQRVICYNCNQKGHTANDCHNEKVFIPPPNPCRRCGGEDHWNKDCTNIPKDINNEIIRPFKKKFVEDEKLFDDVVENNRILFNDEFSTTMGREVTDYKIASFQDFKQLSPQVLSNLLKMKHKKPTPIQRASFFPILSGKDFVACAHTGCGKTLAFLLPLVTNLINDDWDEEESNGAATPRCLIIAPTRELAVQTFNVARQVTYKTDVTVSIVYGGTTRSGNLQHLFSHKKLGILIATMGRLKDFLESGNISLSKVKYVVLDEADRMVNKKDFGEEVNDLIGSPETRKSQLILFSASFSEELQKTDLRSVIKNDFILTQVHKFGTANRQIEQNVLNVSKSCKREKLMEILGIDIENHLVLPDARVLKEKTLIFVNSIKYSITLASILSNSQVSTLMLHSQFDQKRREEILEQFHKGEFQVLVASNVCARGINISHLDHVINYDLPILENFDEYVNRIGRTGRAGFDGESTSFFCPETDSGVVDKLINVIEEAGKKVPEWLESLKTDGQVFSDEEEELW